MEQPLPQDVQKLLMDLERSISPGLRITAAEKLGRLAQNDERIINALKRVAMRDADSAVRRAALNALSPEQSKRTEEKKIKEGLFAGEKRQPLCVVLCELPSEFSAGRAKDDVLAILEKAARFAFNLVDRKYGSISRDWQVDYILKPYGVMYSCDVIDPALAIEVAEYTKQAWRELMADIRTNGIVVFLRA